MDEERYVMEWEVKLPYGKKYPKWLRDHIDAVMKAQEEWRAKR